MTELFHLPQDCHALLYDFGPSSEKHLPTRKRCFLKHNSMFLAPQNCELDLLT